MGEDSTLNLFKHDDPNHVFGEMRIIDGYAVCSDVFMLCVRKHRPDETDHGRDKPPAISSIIKTIDENLSRCVEAMPELNVQLCPECVGEKVHGKNIPCLSCRGSGECYGCDCGHSHSCGKCNGSGFSEIERGCELCNEEGYLLNNAKDGYVEIAGREIRIKAAVVLSWIKDVRLAPINFSDVDLGSIVFRFGEYKGIVLGKRQQNL